VNARRRLTLGSVPPEMLRALEREALRRGSSLSQTAVDLLCAGLGVRQPLSNGLRRFAGTWSAEDLERFTAIVALSEVVDAELWR